jgi:predicted N-acetyltransferase YhbS
MCDNANLIVTARKDGKLIGVARSITDFAYCTYLSDLAVDIEYQNQGIGKKLIKETKKELRELK